MALGTFEMPKMTDLFSSDEFVGTSRKQRKLP